MPELFRFQDIGGIVMKKIWFDKEYIYAETDEGEVKRQSLLWYPALKDATDEERNAYRKGFGGYHWRNLDVDISFDSFSYDDAEPTPLQRFFLTHKELNVDEVARTSDISPSMLNQFINGFMKPSKECETKIVSQIHSLGKEYANVNFSMQ